MTRERESEKERGREVGSKLSLKRFREPASGTFFSPPLLSLQAGLTRRGQSGQAGEGLFTGALSRSDVILSATWSPFSASPRLSSLDFAFAGSDLGQIA